MNKFLTVFILRSQKQNSDGQLFLIGTLPELHMTMVLEDYFQTRYDVSVVARSRGEVSLPNASYASIPATSPDNCGDVHGRTDSDFANVNVADEPLEHFVMNTKFTELREACRHAIAAFAYIV